MNAFHDYYLRPILEATDSAVPERKKVLSSMMRLETILNGMTNRTGVDGGELRAFRGKLDSIRPAWRTHWDINLQRVLDLVRDDPGEAHRSLKLIAVDIMKAGNLGENVKS